MRKIWVFILLYTNLAFSITPKSFEQFIEKTQIPYWMYAQVEEDLSPFTTEFNKQSLDKFFFNEKIEEEFPLVRICTHKQQLEITLNKRAKAFCPGVRESMLYGIKKLLELINLPDFDCILNLSDTLLQHEIDKMLHIMQQENPFYTTIPIFTESKTVNKRAGGILIPCRFSVRDFQPEKDLILESNKKYSIWNQKIPKIFFRGKDTGTQPIENIWINCPRPKLALLSKKFPHFIDAKILADNFKNMQILAKQLGIYGSFISMAEHSKYKYLIDLDGNCASAPRCCLLMFSNSVLFKHITHSKQWWYKTLKPFIHYIPVAWDLSDIFCQLNWAIQHDEECKTIAENASNLAESVLSEHMTFLYFYHLIQTYAENQKKSYTFISTKEN